MVTDGPAYTCRPCGTEVKWHHRCDCCRQECCPACKYGCDCGPECA